MAKNDNRAAWAGFLMFLCAVALLGGVVANRFIDWRTNRRCLELGWPDHKVNIFSGYCIARVNQTDVVKPVGSAERR